MKHCVNLHRVDMSPLTNEIADILIALGSRIRVLGIGHDYIANFERWREVYRACTNLEAVHLAAHGFHRVIDILSMMRAKLVSLELRRMGGVISTGDRFCSVLSACSVLKEVELVMRELLPEALLRRLFQSLKSVTALMCSIYARHVNTSKDIIDAMARHLSNLESFTLSAYDSLYEGEDVKALVNLPHLKYVTLRGTFSMNSVSKPLEEYAVEIVKKLKGCPRLTQLVIVDRHLNSRSTVIAEAARTYKRQDFDMFIGDVQYRTW